MTHVLESPLVHEISAADGTIQVKATFTPGYINRLLIEESWPQNLGEDKFDIRHIAYRELANYDMEHEERKTNSVWIDSVMTPLGPSPDSVQLAPQQFEGLTQSLGFSLDTQLQTADGTTTQVRQYSYPSIARANDVMDFMSDALDEEAPFAFVPFEGGEYTAEEFMQSFVEGRVLISTQPPYNLHDLSDHVVGWVGLSPDFVRIFQSRIGVYLERLEAEYAIEPNLDLEAIGGEFVTPQKLEKQQEFFLPSLAIIKASMRSIDDVTTQIADTALNDRGVTRYNNLGDEFGRHLAGAFNIYSTNATANQLPTGLLGTVNREQRYRFGTQTHLRFKTGHELPPVKAA
jgi:hypothetical protein